MQVLRVLSGNRRKNGYRKCGVDTAAAPAVYGRGAVLFVFRFMRDLH
jgi:hypothetical protein